MLFFLGRKEKQMNIPVELKYTQNDEWVRVEGTQATVGISDYAQSELSDVVFVEVVVNEGDAISKKDTIATVESVKAAADVYTPISGQVIEVNADLPGAPETVNSDPYGAAWLVKLELSSPTELDSLMDAAAYETYCQGRKH
jgi:glycine cleavage system H protein